MTRDAALKLYRDAEAGAGREGARKRWRMASQALATVTDDAAGQRAFATACETHKRADWRIAARALADALQGAEKRPERAIRIKAEPKAQTLIEYLAHRGGLRDEGGELRRMDAHLWHRDAAFRRRFVAPAGMTYDEACDVAHDAGYFDDVPFPAWDSSDNQHAVTPDQLFAAIRRELAGKTVYPYAPGNQLADDDYWQEAA